MRIMAQQRAGVAVRRPFSRAGGGYPEEFDLLEVCGDEGDGRTQEKDRLAATAGEHFTHSDSFG
jgi:hypothetical protein